MTSPLPRLTLVLGGARSGKSRYGEQLMTSVPQPWTYIATAEARDDEMRTRIDAHIARRGPGWTTHEVPLDLISAIKDIPSGIPTLVDCLTLWLSNVMLADRNVDAERASLCAALQSAPGPLVLISNEVGLGIVPETTLGREFRDAQGRLNAEVAAIADHVVFLAAGLPLVLKPRTQAP
jgi:adenosylcobinamide kinase/adenosylcobinamide-phosphate guanylyltransferase